MEFLFDFQGQVRDNVSGDKYILDDVIGYNFSVCLDMLNMFW